MDKLIFANGYMLNLLPMGASENGDLLSLQVTPRGTLTEMETALLSALGGNIEMQSDAGEVLHIYRGFDHLANIGKEWDEAGAEIAQLTLRRTSELERRLDEVEAQALYTAVSTDTLLEE